MNGARQKSKLSSDATSVEVLDPEEELDFFELHLEVVLGFLRHRSSPETAKRRKRERTYRILTIEYVSAALEIQ